MIIASRCLSVWIRLLVVNTPNNVRRSATWPMRTKSIVSEVAGLHSLKSAAEYFWTKRCWMWIWTASLFLLLPQDLESHRSKKANLEVTYKGLVSNGITSLILANWLSCVRTPICSHFQVQTCISIYQARSMLVFEKYHIVGLLFRFTCFDSGMRHCPIQL